MSAPPLQVRAYLDILDRRFGGPRPSRMRRITGAILILWLLTGVYIIRTDQQGVVTRLGAVVEPRVMPGIHVALPWPIDRVARLKVRQLQRLVVGGELPDTITGRAQPLQSQFLTGDKNIINLRVVVQYSVGVPVEYLFRSENVAKSVASAVESALAARIARSDVDFVFTTGKLSIQEEVQRKAQETLNEYHSGVLLSSINLESAVPPPEAADAFRDVASARADSARIVSEAQGYANDLIPKARGQAQQILEESQGYKDKIVNEAQGDAARFTEVAAEYAKASEVNGQRLYLETMEQILPKIKKLIVDNKGNLDLTIIRKDGSGK